MIKSKKINIYSYLTILNHKISDDDNMYIQLDNKYDFKTYLNFFFPVINDLLHIFKIFNHCEPEIFQWIVCPYMILLYSINLMNWNLMILTIKKKFLEQNFDAKFYSMDIQI